MARSSKKVIPKKRRAWGSGKEPMLAFRLAPTVKAEVDSWAAKQPDKPSRSEAIRRLLDQALAATRK